MAGRSPEKSPSERDQPLPPTSPRPHKLPAKESARGLGTQPGVVKDQLAVRSPIVDSAGKNVKLYLGYLGTNQFTVEAPVDGTVIAPNARMEMGTSNALYFEGAYMAKSLVVRPGVTVTCINPGTPAPTPIPSCSDGLKNQDETAVDCGGICADTCDIGEACVDDGDCTDHHCVSGVCQAPAVGCTEATAVDLGTTGNAVTVPTNGCVMVRNQYPSWWGTRTMLLQNMTPGTYPTPFTWRNTCAASSGSESFTADWQSKMLSQTSSNCATIITLGGTGTGNVTLRYYGT